MLGHTKESWAEFATELQDAGYTVLAIDPRGHGDSEGGDYKLFDAGDWASVRFDITKGIAVLKEQGAEDVYLIGASMGANLALKYASEDREIRKIVLLSPGLDYQGITTDTAAYTYKNEVLYVVSKDDASSYQSTLDLYDTTNKGKKLIEYDDAGHGTTMLDKEPDLGKQIITWLG
jgi:pimeloyl-ACP methyl ester carboxylesterase